MTKYCRDVDCQKFVQGISTMLGPVARHINIPIHQNITVMEREGGETIQLYLPRVEVLGVDRIDELTLEHTSTNHSLTIKTSNVQVTLYGNDKICHSGIL